MESQFMNKNIQQIFDLPQTVEIAATLYKNELQE